MLEAVYGFLDNHIILYLSTHLIALLYLLLLNRRAIAKHFTGIKKNTWILLLIIFLLGFSLRNAEYWYGLNSDDYASLEGAKFLVVEGKYVRACAHGMLGECYAYHYVLQPPGSSFLAALVYMAFGINSIPVLILFGIMSSLTVIIVFLLCHLLFRNDYVGLCSSLIFSVIPLNILFSGTGCERIISVFFISLAVLFYLIAIRNNDLKSWVLFALSLSFSIYMRQENYVLLMLFIAGFLLFRYNILRNLRKLLVAGAVFMLFQIHVMYWTVFSPLAQVVHPLGLPVMSHMCMVRAAPYIAWFLTGFVPFWELSMPYNYLASIFFLAGICISFFYVLSGKRSQYGLFFVFLWFLLFFMSYSSYCMNFMEGLSHDPDSSYMRYCVQFSVPYSILAGYAIYLLHVMLRRKIPHKILGKGIPYKAIPKGITILILGAILLISLSHTFPSGVFMDNRTTHDHGDFPAIMRIPQNSTIITSLWMLVASDVVDGERKAVSLDVIVKEGTPEHSIRLIHESSDVYYIKEPSCDTYTDIFGCEFIRKNLNLSYSFSEGGTDVYRVIVEPDAEYNFVWDDAEYNVTVRSNRIVSIEKEYF